MSAIRAGYKQTEVGVIPEDWEVKALGGFVSLQRGHDLTERDRRAGSVPVIGSAGQNGFHDTALVKGPGVVVGRSGASFGQAHFCEADFWPHNTGLYVTDFHGNDRLFAFYFLRSFDFSRHNSGGAQQSLNRNFIAPIPVCIPPLEEQKAIAEALSDADALIELLEQLLAKKRHLKQGAMQELLTGKKRLPGFRGEWQLKCLKDMVQTPITDGPHLTPKFLDSGVPFLSVNNLANNRIDLTDLRFISRDDDYVFSRKCKPRRNDILIGKAASVGKVALVDFDLDFNIWSPIALIRVGNVFDPRFVYYQLLGPDVASQITLLTNSSSQGNIGMGDIEKLHLLVPEIDEQAAIATILSDMDAGIADLEAQLAKTRAMKQGMMQKLLTGEIRLI